MFPPEPYTYHCLDCGWRKTLAPKSDGLGPGDFFSWCPSCQSDNLVRELARRIERTLAKFRRRLGL